MRRICGEREKEEKEEREMVQEFKVLAAGVAATALGGVGTGIGTIFGSYLIAAATNPSMSNVLFNYAIIGFALCEAMGLFALMVAFLLLFS